MLTYIYNGNIMELMHFADTHINKPIFKIYLNLLNIHK